MENLIDSIDSIEKRIGKLLQAYDLLKQENGDLKKQIEKRQDKIAALQQTITSLSTENQNLKTANGLLGSDDFKRETKLKINSLIKEIDLCINQLSG